MARDLEGIIQTKFAETGDSVAPEALDPPRTFTFQGGFPLSFSQAGGNSVPRTTINYLNRVITAALVDLNQMGVLEWNGTVNYKQWAVVVSPLGQISQAKEITGPATSNATNPDLDPNRVIWDDVSRGDSPWVTPDLNEGWEGLQGFQYRVEQNGAVLRFKGGVVGMGAALNPPQDDPVFTLPLELRPTVETDFWAYSSVGSLHSVLIASSGAVRVRMALSTDKVTNTVPVFFDGITFHLR